MENATQSKYKHEVEEVLKHLRTAEAKFPTWPDDPLHALAIIGEEFGELSQAVLQCVYEPNKSSPVHIKLEVQQTAAMCLRFLKSLERGNYNFKKSNQHRV